MDSDLYIDILKKMLLVRESDKRASILLRQGKAWFHMSAIGHEALIALAYHLQEGDYFFPYYRDRALVYACGMSIEALARDVLGKANSHSGGRNMSEHFSYALKNIFSIASPVASQCLPAVGTAWAMQLRAKKNIVLCGIGDASLRQGEFYEALCFAVEKKLPIVFVISDNKYGISTLTTNMMPFRLNIFNKALYQYVQGWNVIDVYHKSAQAIEKVRQGNGPCILWCEVDRLESHSSSDDHRVYRSSDELMQMKDCLQIYVDWLQEKNYLNAREIENLKKDTQRKVESIYDVIEKEEIASSAEIKNHLFGVKPQRYPPIPLCERDTTLTMVQALNHFLKRSLAIDSSIILFGQDIADPKGGVFGFTKGLSSQFPLQVFNAPLAEATILGVAVGLAAYGLKPVFELQFIDFIGPGLNQLCNQIATLRWRTMSSWSCPMVLYAPYGAYLPGGGIWHSQSNEGFLSHIPGIRIAVPSNPKDMIGLFWSAIQDPDPSLILIPKHLMRKKMWVDKFEITPFGQGVIHKEGKDVTLVAWGNCIELALAAAQQFNEENIDIEIIDLRTIVPCDWNLIKFSLEKTGRLVVVQEDNKTSSFGATIISEVLSNADYFDLLYAPPQLVSRDDLPIPFHPELERAIMPNVDLIIKAIKKTLGVIDNLVD